MLRKTLHRVVLISSVFMSAWAGAQSLTDSGILPTGDRAIAVPERVEEQTRSQWSTGTYGPVPAAAITGDIRPFGSHLFTGGFSGLRSDGLNDDYMIAPGDQVTLRVWGAIELERVLPVDAQGNIFIPSIGPISVKGLSNSQLNGRVKSAILSVYPENVNVYTNLQGVQPVAVFVAGYVTHPGRYAGTPNDSLLYFLDQAGGIDDQLGSYRRVKVLRQNKVIAEADLYDFLIEGKLVRPQFKDGDTILIEERGPSVTVTGDVQREYHYELTPSDLSGEALLRLARLKSGVSHVLLRGGRTQGPISVYYDIGEFPQQSLQSGDELLFSADQRDETIVVQLEGSFYGPSRYALPKDARLHELLSAVAVPQTLTDVNSVSLRRVSVAERQKQSLLDSLNRLEATYLGASSSTAQEAQIRVTESELISRFVQKASQVEPTGRLVVARNDQISDIRLQDGDIITLPEYSDAVLISGEVRVPQSVVFTPGLTAYEYIDGAGGFTQHADINQVLVIRQNGEVVEARNIVLRAGDEILVLPKVPVKNLQLASVISQIVFNMAAVAKVVLDL
ncbi:polysaccharide biosynthesis/export family protein [Nitrincola tibetensis]|nr:polysaccharide biosynthesis/export family protein [Nitrincola tibetensis]